MRRLIITARLGLGTSRKYRMIVFGSLVFMSLVLSTFKFSSERGKNYLVSYRAIYYILLTIYYSVHHFVPSHEYCFSFMSIWADIDNSIGEHKT